MQGEEHNWNKTHTMTLYLWTKPVSAPNVGTSTDLCFSNCSINPKVNVFSIVTSERNGQSLFLYWTNNKLYCLLQHDGVLGYVPAARRKTGCCVPTRWYGAHSHNTTRLQYSWMTSFLSLDWLRGSHVLSAHSPYLSPPWLSSMWL